MHNAWDMGRNLQSMLFVVALTLTQVDCRAGSFSEAVLERIDIAYVIYLDRTFNNIWLLALFVDL